MHLSWCIVTSNGLPDMGFLEWTPQAPFWHCAHCGAWSCQAPISYARYYIMYLTLSVLWERWPGVSRWHISLSSSPRWKELDWGWWVWPDWPEGGRVLSPICWKLNRGKGLEGRIFGGTPPQGESTLQRLGWRDGQNSTHVVGNFDDQCMLSADVYAPLQPSPSRKQSIPGLSPWSAKPPLPSHWWSRIRGELQILEVYCWKRTPSSANIRTFAVPLSTYVLIETHIKGVPITRSEKDVVLSMGFI